MSQQNPQDLSQYKTYFDTLISYTSCTGYQFVGTQGHLVCAEFSFVGGKFPLALDVRESVAHNVDVLTRGINLMQFMDRLPKLKVFG